MLPRYLPSWRLWDNHYYNSILAGKKAFDKVQHPFLTLKHKTILSIVVIGEQCFDIIYNIKIAEIRSAF